MISRSEGIVSRITGQAESITYIKVEVAGEDYPAINFDNMTGPVIAGDRVLLNTTAVDLNLGTGGNHFVMANLSSPAGDDTGAGEPGHIMKIRYTPSQIKVLSAEEQDSPYHNLMADCVSLRETPVICCSLHSMLLPAAAAVKAENEHLKVVYVMTDGASLPLAFSRMVKTLKKERLIEGTVTTGHAFGGDIETVNIYSGLLAALAVLKADIIIAAMGPGIVGTGTTFGFSGIEQAGIIHAVHTLKGIPIAVPRIGFADTRERHKGLSHHSRTVLGKATLVPAFVGLPEMAEDKEKMILSQMHQCGITSKHKIVREQGKPGLELLAKHQIRVTTMGRSVAEEPEFFLAASCAGRIAAKIAVGEELDFWEEEKN